MYIRVIANRTNPSPPSSLPTAGTTLPQRDESPRGSGRLSEASTASVASSLAPGAEHPFSKDEQEKPASAAAEVQITIGLMDAQLAAVDAQQVLQQSPLLARPGTTSSQSVTTSSQPPSSAVDAVDAVPPKKLLEISTALKLEFLFRVCWLCLRRDLDKRVSIEELLEFCRAERGFFRMERQQEGQHYENLLTLMAGARWGQRDEGGGDDKTPKTSKRSRKIALQVFPWDGLAPLPKNAAGKKNAGDDLSDSDDSLSFSRLSLVGTKKKRRMLPDARTMIVIEGAEEPKKCTTRVCVLTITLATVVLLLGIMLLLVILCCVDRNKTVSYDWDTRKPIFQVLRYDPQASETGWNGGAPGNYELAVEIGKRDSRLQAATDEKSKNDILSDWLHFPSVPLDWEQAGLPWERPELGDKGVRKYLVYPHLRYEEPWAAFGTPMTWEDFKRRTALKKKAWEARKKELEEAGTPFDEFGEKNPDCWWDCDMHEAPWPPNPYPAKYPALAPKEIAGLINIPDVKDLPPGVGDDAGGGHGHGHGHGHGGHGGDHKPTCCQRSVDEEEGKNATQQTRFLESIDGERPVVEK